MRLIERGFAHSERLGKLAPEDRMRRCRIEFFGEIIFHQFSERFFRTIRELLQILRKGTDVLIVLLRIKLKRFAGKRAFRPSLVERMLEEVILLDEGVERFEHSSCLYAILGHCSFLIFPFFSERRNIKTARCYLNGNSMSSLTFGKITTMARSLPRRLQQVTAWTPLQAVASNH